MFLQNSRKEYNHDSKKPAPWKWFKGDPNNPYKVPNLVCCFLSASVSPLLDCKTLSTCIQKKVTKSPWAYSKHICNSFNRILFWTGLPVRQQASICLW